MKNELQKYCLPTVLLFLCAIALHGQNEWAPFPHGQRTFWQYGQAGVLHYNDVTRPGTGTDTLLFGAEYRYGISDGACFDTIVNRYFVNPFYIPPGWERPAIRPDTVLRTGHSYVAWADGTPRTFLADADLGQQWTVTAPTGAGFDSLRWTCTSISTGVLHGQATLLKHYTGLRFAAGQVADTLALVLSRDYGFAQFVPFQQWFQQEAQVFRLFGWTDGEVNYGFTNRYEEYFDVIVVGSVFKLTIDSAAMFGPPLKLMVRDSVIGKLTEPDGSITLTYLRRYRTDRGSWANPDFQLFNHGVHEYTRTFRRAFYEHLLAQTPYWFFYQEPSGQYWDYHHPTTPLMMDSLGRVTFGTYGQESPAGEECGYSLVHGCYRSQHITTGVGITAENQGCGTSFGSRTRLVGYRIGEDTWGDVDTINVIVSAESLAKPALAKVYPNPGRDELYIVYPDTWPTATPSQVTILDATGRTLLTALHLPGQPVRAIGLPPGLYTIRVANGSQALHGRWVVGE